MAEVNKIIKYCKDYLKVENFKDYCVNGLQVQGVDTTAKVVTGVSLSECLIKAAIKKQAKLIIVHHGIFKNDIGELPAIKGVLKNRLKLLLENNINLAGFHLPLDAHPEIGNNISLLNLLGLKRIDSIGEPGNPDIGYIGALENKMSFVDFTALVEQKLAAKCYVIPAGKKNVKQVGIISGGASPNFTESLEAGADTYLCGDVRESIVRAVEEAKINFINAGHYNTEKMGIRNLGELVAKKFDISVEFVDIPCEI